MAGHESFNNVYEELYAAKNSMFSFFQNQELNGAISGTNDSHIVLKASIKERKRNIVFVEAAIYNNKEELCTKALCTYFTFSQEKAKEEMHFLNCEVEQDEIIPLI